MRFGRTALLVAATLLAATACGSGSGGDTLTLYNAQSAEIGKAWADAFTAQTGIPVAIRNGSDPELANQIVQEGAASPADVFLTENSTPMALLSGKGLLAPVDAATRAQVPAQYSSGRGDWVGVAARSTVFVYNPAQLPAGQVPTSILDLARPEWKGRFAFAPTGADFQAIASAVFATQGEAAGTAWLQGLKDNGRVYQNNITILKGVDAGEVPGGISYHYYWFQDRANGAPNSANTELAYFAGQNSGGFVSVSGGAVLASSKRAAAAQRFLAFVTSAQGQTILAKGPAKEYTVASGVPADPALRPLAQLDPPKVDLNALNGPAVIAAMQRIGLL